MVSAIEVVYNHLCDFARQLGIEVHPAQAYYIRMRAGTEALVVWVEADRVGLWRQCTQLPCGELTIQRFEYADPAFPRNLEQLISELVHGQTG